MPKKTPEEELKKTASLCPECLKIIPARIFEREGKVWISKKCPKHGPFEEIYWGDSRMYKKAEGFARDGRGVSNPQIAKESPVCPRDCGLCKAHKSHTALANIVATNRCNLSCFYCFFFAKRLGYVYEPSLGQIRQMLRNLRNERPVPNNALQITGGEPCLRDDIVEIIKMAKEEGFDHVQLNTNGIRLSQDLELVKQVREAGVNTLYLSFDGLTPKTNPKNHWEVPGVMENCRKADIGIVLVPTIIKGRNDHELGEMIRFGFRNIDVIRSVNFQPVSLVGRMPRKERERFRITIPDAIKRIEEQTNGEIGREDFYPVPTVMPVTRFVEALTGRPEYALTSHFACGLATYVFDVEGRLTPITRFVDVEGLLAFLDERAKAIEEGRANKYATGLSLLWKIGSFIDKNKAPKGFSLSRILFNALIRHNYNALGRFHYKSLFIGMMAFMDMYNYDIDRVKRCCIHYAMTDNRIIPFCAFNVIPEWYRDKSQESQGISLGKWEKRAGKRLKDDLYKRDAKALADSEAYKKVYKTPAG